MCCLIGVGGPPEQTQRFVDTYDANGNRTNLNWPGPPGPDTQGIDYTYDREDRLVLAQAYQTNHRGHRVDREVTRLFYDGLGRRLAKEYDPNLGAGLVSAQGGVKRTEYVFDGLDPVVEYSLWNGQRDEFYRGEEAQLLTMRHFPDGAEGQSYWYHQDGRGSVAGLTKHQGQSTHNYRYDAYGQLLPAHGNWTDPHNHYTFAGKEWDEHLNIYEFGYRLYDPWAGVWLTREPLPGRAGEPRTWHRYQYAFASPIGYYDPYGLQTCGYNILTGESDCPGVQTLTTPAGTVGLYNPQLSPPSAPTEMLQSPTPTGATPPECIPGFIGSGAYHRAVQEYFITYIRPGAQMNVPIPGAGPNGGLGRADLVYGNEIWEVKPDQSWWHGRISQLQLKRYIDHMPGSTPGSYIPPFVVSYGNEQIVVKSYPADPGILFYTVEGSPRQPVPVPVPLPEPEERREEERPLQPVLQPAPVVATVSTLFTIWLAAKLLAPACGPLAPVCAVAF